MEIEKYRSFIAQNLAADVAINDINVELITGDASFRQYYRISLPEEQFILMVSPPELVDNQAFIDLNKVFSRAGLSVPKIFAQDNQQGLLLLEDLGCTHFADCLTNDNAAVLYKQVIELLPTIATIPADKAMKPYDAAFIDLELEIFSTWLVDKFCQIEMDISATKVWQQVKQQLVNALQMQPVVTMHRDYHSRNLMLHNHQWVVIDYQDAVQGPLTYDLVSLTKDCYQVLDPKLRQSLLEYGYQQYAKVGLTGSLSFNDFELLYTLTGIQRHLKAAGIFCRLSLRDGKDGYLPHLLDTLAYVIEACQQLARVFPIFDYFEKWLSDCVIPKLKESL